jgi:hypothetical protein
LGIFEICGIQIPSCHIGDQGEQEQVIFFCDKFLLFCENDMRKLWENVQAFSVK